MTILRLCMDRVESYKITVAVVVTASCCCISIKCQRKSRISILYKLLELVFRFFFFFNKYRFVLLFYSLFFLYFSLSISLFDSSFCLLASAFYTVYSLWYSLAWWYLFFPPCDICVHGSVRATRNNLNKVSYCEYLPIVLYWQAIQLTGIDQHAYLNLSQILLSVLYNVDLWRWMY